MKLRLANSSDSRFIFICLQELIDSKLYTEDDFKLFWDDLFLMNRSCDYWIASVNNNDIGLITANKGILTRYIGLSVELEEIVILPNFRGKGYGSMMINKVVEYYEKDKLCRKILVKTNDIDGSARLYGKIFEKTDMLIFQKYINKIGK